MLIDFLTPYFRFLFGAAYNLHQTLDGLGLSSTSFIEVGADGSLQGGYFSPGQAIVPFVWILVLLTFSTLPILLLAGYVLGRKKGVALVILGLLSPGLLNAFGLLPDLNPIPRTYNIGGTGSLGSAIGFIPLILFGATLGWCLTVVLYDTFKLKDRFRHAYDHLWFLSAVLTGIFFVADTGSNKEAQELAESSSVIRSSSLYLLAQVRVYDAHCLESDLTQTASCRWASRVQQQLNDYAAHHPKIYAELGPHSSRDIYMANWGKISDEEIFQIRNEIKAYNDEQCPVKDLGDGVSAGTPSSGICQRAPGEYCTAFPDPPENLIDRGTSLRTAALASECILPSLVRLRLQQKKLLSVVSENEESKHYRWLFFIFFSIIVGGKIANSTTRIVDMDNRPDAERQRLFSLMRCFFGCLTRVVSFTRTLIIWLFSLIRRLRPWIRARLISVKKLKNHYWPSNH